MENAFRFLCFLVFFTTSKAGVVPQLNPGDRAPDFGLQTNSNLLSYPKDIQGPLVLFAFTNDSAFLENIFSDPEQFVFDLIEHSPDNAHYVFVFHDKLALGGLEHCKTLEKKINEGLVQFHNKKGSQYRQVQSRTFRWNKNYTRKNIFPQQYFDRVRHRMHCASFPIHMLGNWIPRVLAKWSCDNSFCGLYQIAVENAKGHVLSVSSRLDARYTWLPSFTLLSQTRYMAVSVKNPCALQFDVDVKGRLALVYAGNSNCSAFAKVQNAEKNGAVGVVFYDRHIHIPKELNCHGKECETLLSIPACIVHNQPGFFMENRPGDTYIRFQTTPAETFTFGVDSQGRLQKTDWYLYPSMRFAAYHAQWFNYVDNFISNTTGDAKVIKIFDDRLISNDGLTSADITVPSYDELLHYQNVEVEMSLRCPLTGSGACTHWDHVIRLFVSCESMRSKNPGDELARWIAAYNRRSTSWITPIRSLLPLLKTRSPSSVCRFHIMTDKTVRPWQVTLNLRLSDKTKRLSFTTWKQIDRELVPVQITSLFTGCFFDENCNKKYAPISFIVPPSTAQVKLVASITGLGHDNNNCASNCITTHRFNINHRANATYTKIYKNSASSVGCQTNVEKDDTKRSWLRSREPWCDGQEAIPWEVDVTDSMMFGRKGNTITYRALFNGTDPKPTQNPGTIIMSSYIVYYEYKNLV